MKLYPHRGCFLGNDVILKSISFTIYRLLIFILQYGNVLDYLENVCSLLVVTVKLSILGVCMFIKEQ